MKILKFGGTSVGSPQQMQKVGALVNDDLPKIVVLSAVAGTTNELVEIGELLYGEKRKEARARIAEMEVSCADFIEGLYSSDDFRQKATEMVKAHFEHVRSFSRDMFTIHEERSILAQGELISTALFSYYLEEQGIQAVLLPALDSGPQLICGPARWLTRPNPLRAVRIPGRTRNP